MYVMREHKYIIVGSTASVVVSSPRLSSHVLMKNIRRKYHKQKRAILGTNLMFFIDSVFWKKGSRTKTFYGFPFSIIFFFESTGNAGTAEPETLPVVPLFQKVGPD